MKENETDFEELMSRYLVGDATVAEITAAARRKADLGLRSYISFRKAEPKPPAQSSESERSSTPLLSHIFRWLHK